MSVTIVAVTTLAACASPAPWSESQVERTNVPIYRQTDYAPMARVVGRLVIESDCLVLKGRDGITRGVAWPSEAHWDEVTRQIALDEVAAGVGDDVVLDGGEYAAPVGGGPDVWVVPPTGGCLEPELYWRASSISPPE